MGRVCSLDEPEDVELVVENPGRLPRSMRLRDDVPDEFSAEPAAFDVTVPARRQAILSYRFVPKRRGTYVFEQVDALVASRLGFWRGQYSWPLRTEVRVYPDIHQVARFTMLARRDRLSHDGGAAVAPAGNGQRVRAAARLHRRGRSAPHRLAGLGAAAQADVAGHFSSTRASGSSS